MRTKHRKQSDRGVYVLLLRLDKKSEIRIGKLGTFVFPEGFYTYTGSAMNGLEQRINRHLRRRKRRFWHIDFLLERAQIVAVKKYLTTEKAECLLNTTFMQLKKGSVVARKFGSSDCKCPSHLLHFSKRPLFPGSLKFLNITRRKSK